MLVDIKTLTEAADRCGFDPSTRLVEYVLEDLTKNEVIAVGDWDFIHKRAEKYSGSFVIRQTVSFDSKLPQQVP